MDNAYILPCEKHPDGYMHPQDSLMDGFTLQQLMDAVRNERDVTRDSVYRVFEDIAHSNLQDARSILIANMDTIIETIKRERGETGGSDYDMAWVEKSEKLAYDIYGLLLKYNSWVDVSIYYNGKRMSCVYIDEQGEHYDYHGAPHIEDGYDPRDYFRYVRDPNILSMSFEGPMYDAVNYGNNPAFMKEFNSLLNRYGLYYELGNAWNLTVTKK